MSSIIVIIVKIIFSKFADLSKFGYTSSVLAVIILKIVFISLFFFYCLLLNHSFQTNPNRITNCFKLFSSILQLYKTTFAQCVSSIFDFWKQAKKRDQKLQWKRRYNYDINEIITPYNLCVIVYTLTSKVLTNEDAMLLMTPLVETEKSDDLIIYHNSMDSQRTKRLRVSIWSERERVQSRIWKSL